MTDFFYKYQKYKYKYKIFRSTYFRSISHIKNKYNELSGGVDTDLSDGNEIKYDKCKPFEKCLDDCIKTTGSKYCLDACKKGDGSEVCLNLCKKDNNSDNCKQFKRINEIKKLDNNFDNTYTQINKINYEKIKTIKKINDKLQNNYYIYFFKYNDLLDNDMVKQIIDTYFNINNTDNLLLNKITIQKEEEKIIEKYKFYIKSFIINNNINIFNEIKFFEKNKLIWKKTNDYIKLINSNELTEFNTKCNIKKFEKFHTIKKTNIESIGKLPSFAYNHDDLINYIINNIINIRNVDLNNKCKCEYLNHGSGECNCNIWYSFYINTSFNNCIIIKNY